MCSGVGVHWGWLYVFRCCCTARVAMCLGVAVHGGGYMFSWSKFGQDLWYYTGGGYVCLGGPSLVRTCGTTLGVAMCV